jgi:hypothetical protein
MSTLPSLESQTFIDLSDCDPREASRYVEGLIEKVFDTPTVVLDGPGRESTLLVQILPKIGHELGKTVWADFGDLQTAREPEPIGSDGNEA